eukprot:6201335-Pleurochrysis_carterae.AAC.2
MDHTNRSATRNALLDGKASSSNAPHTDSFGGGSKLAEVQAQVCSLSSVLLATPASCAAPVLRPAFSLGLILVYCGAVLYMASLLSFFSSLFYVFKANIAVPSH